MSEHPQVLVATFSQYPNLVTYTLDLLLQKGYPVSEVVVVHTNPIPQPHLQSALGRLHAEFPNDIYQAGQHVIHFRSHVLELDGQPIDDITTNDHTDGVLDSLHRLINSLKRQGYRIHLSISDGHLLTATLAVSLAMFNLDRHDHIWYMNPRKEDVMHLPSDADVQLIEAPFIALGAYISPLARFSRSDEQYLQMRDQDRARCAEVVERATPAQRKVLRAFTQGLRPQEVAEELQLAIPTVSSHCTFLFALCRTAWGIPPKEHMDYLFLRAHFADYFGHETPSQSSGVPS